MAVWVDNGRHSANAIAMDPKYLKHVKSLIDEATVTQWAVEQGAALGKKFTEESAARVAEFGLGESKTISITNGYCFDCKKPLPKGEHGGYLFSNERKARCKECHATIEKTISIEKL
jgi:hypothetical protein